MKTIPRKKINMAIVNDDSRQFHSIHIDAKPSKIDLVFEVALRLCKKLDDTVNCLLSYVHK